VIHVGVGEDHGVDRRRINGELGPVSLPLGAQALEQSAVHEDPSGARLEQEPAARDGAGGTEERQDRGCPIPTA